MKHIVSFSGGRTSAYLCYLVKKLKGDDVDFIFMDTGGEHPETYEFIRKCNSEFDLNLTCLRGDFSKPLGEGIGYHIVDISEIGPDLKPYREMMQKYGVPYIGGMFCTERMKTRPHDKYCDDVYGKKNYTVWLGMRADEPKRVLGKKLYAKMKERFDDAEIDDIISNSLLRPRLPVDELYGRLKGDLRYLAQVSDFDKQDILEWWSRRHFDLGIEEHLGNCVFCPKKSDLKLAAANRDEPQMYHEFLCNLHFGGVRVDENTGNRETMYRGKQSLEELIAKFDGHTGEEIKSRLRYTKQYDTGSCSESCELRGN